MFDDDFGGCGSGCEDHFTMSGSGLFDDAFTSGSAVGDLSDSFTAGGDHDMNFLMGTDTAAEAWRLPADSVFWANSGEIEATSWYSGGIAGFFIDFVDGANKFLARWTTYEP